MAITFNPAISNKSYMNKKKQSPSFGATNPLVLEMKEFGAGRQRVWQTFEDQLGHPGVVPDPVSLATAYIHQPAYRLPIADVMRRFGIPLPKLPN